MASIVPIELSDQGSLEFLARMNAIVVSEPMRQVMRVVERVARTGAATLITGESGAGKELIARALHHFSPRSSREWVDVNCSALPEHLVESELFGHEKGAFTGADSVKPGFFELANTGTLFLDEIGDLDPRIQVKLLRVLDGAPYYRLGGQRKIATDVRIVTATNRDLSESVNNGQFRKDLYHRLAQVHIRVPALRERRDDIVPLAHFFLAQMGEVRQFSAGAIKALQNYSWPGNVRELRNVVTQAALLSDSHIIESVFIPGQTCEPGEHPVAVNLHESTSTRLEEMNRKLILEVLSEAGGQQQKAAELLGISRRTLSRKLKSYSEATH